MLNRQWQPFAGHSYSPGRVCPGVFSALLQRSIMQKRDDVFSFQPSPLMLGGFLRGLQVDRVIRRHVLRYVAYRFRFIN